MAFAAARRAEQQNVGALRKPAVARCERHHLRLADHRHRLELEVGERLAGGQSCFRQVTFDATTTAIGDLVLGERGQETSSRPTFLVGLLGELFPHQLDGRQAQVGEQQFDARNIGRIGGLHATPPASTEAARTAASSS